MLTLLIYWKICPAVKSSVLVQLGYICMFPLHQLVLDWITDPASPPLSYNFAVMSLLSPAYMVQPSASCLVLFIQETPWAFCFALIKAGNNMAARMAIMAMTTSNSIKVKPRGKGKKASVRREGVFMFSQ